MKKVCIIYASMSGNTEEIMGVIKKAIEQDVEIDILEMENLDASVILTYDGIILGSYTWGDGDLPYEAEEFYDQLGELDLTDKVVGCFGSGDHAYPKFCAAVDQFLDRVAERGAKVVNQGLKIEFAPDTEEELEQCHVFASQFIGLLLT